MDPSSTAAGSNCADPTNTINNGNNQHRSIIGLMEDIDRMDQYIKEISNYINVMRTLPSEDAKRNIESIQDKLKELALHITSELKKIEQQLDKDGSGPLRNTADYKIKKAHYSKFLKRFNEMMLDYNRIQEEFIHKSKDQRKSGDGTHQDSNSPLAYTSQPNSQPSTTVNHQSYLMNNHSDTNDDLDMMLSEVYMRHERILELEQDIQDLTAISKDIQSMVTEQQIIDSIDHQVEVAVDHVCHATVHVRRRRRCCIQ